MVLAEEGIGDRHGATGRAPSWRQHHHGVFVELPEITTSGVSGAELAVEQGLGIVRALVRFAVGDETLRAGGVGRGIAFGVKVRTVFQQMRDRAASDRDRRASE